MSRSMARLVLFGSLLALTLVGCQGPRTDHPIAEHPGASVGTVDQATPGFVGRAPHPDDRASLVRLVDRIVLLHDRLQAAKRPTPEDRAELNLVLSEIRDWRKRSGRPELEIKEPAPGTIARDNAIDIDCECPLVKSYPLEICFLVSTSDCTAGEERGCTYVCVEMPGEVVGMWKPPAAR